MAGSVGATCYDHGPASAPQHQRCDVKILALETSGTAGSLAAADGANLLLEVSLDPHARSAQSLAPALDELFSRMHWTPADLGLVAVSSGPGSFTGLRVGVTAAKTLAYCAKAEILNIDTLETIAAAVPTDFPLLSTAVDAQRGQVMARGFRSDEEGLWTPTGPAGLVNVEQWLNGLPQGAAVAGPVLARLAGAIPGHVRLLQPSFWEPKASSVARLAWRRYQAGERGDLWSLVPNYSRPSAAEEKARRSTPRGKTAE